VRITVDYTSFSWYDDDGYGGEMWWYWKVFQVSLNGTPLTHACGFKNPTVWFSSPPTYPIQAPEPSDLNGSWFFCVDANDPDHNGAADYYDPGALEGFGVQGAGDIDDLLVGDSTNVPSKTLSIASSFAGASGVPSIPSTNAYAYGTPVLCRVTNSPVSMGVATQMVCTGWTNGTGTLPLSGTGATVTATMNADSGLRWTWRTRYLLDTEVEGGGTVSPPDGWHNAGTSAMLQATANGGYRFAGWSGDVPLAQTNDNPLSVVMNRSRRVTARFLPAAMPQYTAQGTPYTWLESFGFTTNQESADKQDQDRDGAFTWEEYVAGTVPTNPRSVFALLSQTRSGNVNVIRWYGTRDSGVTNAFRVYRSSNLVNWVLITPPAGVSRSSSGTNTWSDPAPPAGRTFYRPAIPWEGAR